MDPHPVSNPNVLWDLGGKNTICCHHCPVMASERDVKPSLIPLLSNSLPLLSVALTSLMEAFATTRQ